MNLIFDDNDHMYIADRGNSRIVMAYNGEYEKAYDLGVQPATIAWDARKENIFIGTNGAWGIYKLCLADGTVTKICGSVKPTAKDMYTDGSDPLAATVGNATGIVVDENGYVWFDDFTCHTFRVIVPGPAGDYTKGFVRTVAGQCFAAGKDNGEGLKSKFKQPGMLVRDAAGDFYVADGQNNLIRKITPVK